MYQQGNNSNNVQIQNAGSQNTININQNQSNHTQLLPDNNSQQYNKQELEKDRNKGIFKFISGLLIFFISIIADISQISAQFHLDFVPFLGFIIAVLLILWAIPHRRSWTILSKLQLCMQNESVYIGNNEIAEAIDDKTIITYSRSAKCTFPNCTGTIVLLPAPERKISRLDRQYIGVCNKDPQMHSYRLDYNWVAYPEQFDWRPIEKK